jgi:hypothetical protein
MMWLAKKKTPVPESIQALRLQIERAFMYTHDEDPSKSNSTLLDRGEESTTQLFLKKKEPSDVIVHQKVSQLHL